MSSNLATFLTPIEDPQDEIMKMAYEISHRRFGKVLTPLKVVYAHMPPEFGEFSARISELDKRTR